MRDSGLPVSSDRYTERYYLDNCGGIEFFKLYGPKILKPSMTYALRRAELKDGMRILDIGCGRGEVLYHVRQGGGRGVGTDYAAAALPIASQVSGCPVLRCDAKALPFVDRSFDRVFFIGVMDHLHDWELEACFREIGRVLAPGGFVLIQTCANRLYFKNWTYGCRRGIVETFEQFGVRLPKPSPARSDEDRELHVNEHSYFTMRSFFRRIGWDAEVELRPNDKLTLKEVYGNSLPEGFPMKPAPEWKSWLYRHVLWRPPLNWILAREFFCVARPEGVARLEDMARPEDMARSEGVARPEDMARSEDVARPRAGAAKDCGKET